jgi:lysophospholipase L1-like esterase
VLWTRPPDASGGSAIVGSRLVDGRWQPLSPIGTALNARLSAVASNDRITIAWHERAGLRVAATADSRTAPWRLRDLRRPLAGTAAIEVALPGTYVGFGDSITVGIIAPGDVVDMVEPYTTFLAEYIEDLIGQPVPVRNDGLPGELTAEGLNRIGISLASDPDFVMILEGANDVSVLLDSDLILNNLTSMVRQTAASGSIPLLASITPRPENGGFQGGINDRTVELNAEIERIAAEEGAIFVDQHAAFMFRPDLYADNIHPNQNGYRHMAKVWFAALKPILNDWLDDRDTTGDSERDAALGVGAQRDDRRRS